MNYLPIFEAETIAGKLAEKLPINKPVPFNPELLIAAIELGMLIVIKYLGAKNKSPQGMERTIYPLIWGSFNDPTKQYLRAYHLTGFSVSKKAMVIKTWRMFRLDRIQSMTLTGSFFKLPPEGFKADSPGFPRVIKMADFNSIIKKQNEYFIQKKERERALKENRLPKVEVIQTGEVLDFDKPYNINEIKNSMETTITILRKRDKTRYLAIDGAGGALNSFLEIIEKNISLGEYEVIKILTGPSISQVQSIDGKKQIEYFKRK